MTIIILILTISILIAGGFLAAFIWSIKDGQMDDTTSPSSRILFEENQTKQ
jgi:cbb3-type cytochrome oxidase maturation protein